MVTKLIEMNNRSYYFWNDVIFIENFDPNLVRIDKKECQIDINMFFIGYIVKKPKYSIDSVNPLYLYIRSLEGYIEKINNTADKNFVITSKLAKSKFDIVWKCIENKIDNLLKKDKTISIIDKYKIRFDSDMNLPLNTPITFNHLTLVIICVIERNKSYPQIFLENCVYNEV